MVVPRLPKLRWLPFAFGVAAVWWASSQPIAGPPLVPHIDKVAHLLVFGLLGLAARWPLLSRPLWHAWALAAGYGVVDELHQYFGDAGRSAEVLDWVADALGAWLAINLAQRMGRKPAARVEEVE